MGCSNNTNYKAEVYNGPRLRIGVIGSIPEVRENQIEFETIEFETLAKKSLDFSYDAIFITEENLVEASKAQYAPIYKESLIPFYFIGNEKFDSVFIIEDLSYEDVPDSKDGSYITGIFYIKNEFIGYGLYNNTKNTKNIKATYSQVFEDISETKNSDL